MAMYYSLCQICYSAKFVSDDASYENRSMNVASSCLLM
jgi:hypothetical protein